MKFAGLTLLLLSALTTTTVVGDQFNGMLRQKTAPINQTPKVADGRDRPVFKENVNLNLDMPVSTEVVKPIEPSFFEDFELKTLFESVMVNSVPKIENYIIDRKTNKREIEFVPDNVRFALVVGYKLPSVSKLYLFRKALKKLSIKQGVYYNSPASYGFINEFQKMYGLTRMEEPFPPPKYYNFNQFFYRRLDLNRFRKMEDPTNGNIVRSIADCRFIVFPTVQQAKQYWIKGKTFSIEAMLGPTQSKNIGLKNPSVAIFRLAPQDYHRFHSPTGGTITAIHEIKGEYYTVNPIAVRSEISVFSENKRTVVEITRPNGQVVKYVCIGATGVGGIHLTISLGQTIKAGDEVGYFAFGGSTIVMLADNVKFDNDLLKNSLEKQTETYITVRSKLGVFM
ncbi:phosphatidylserine decarboxylase-domain-containing protein [Syncephalis fuscata]|nr:phosphatidylserine decarboxylase-domain-containing protein [Syncephalis fuscata]